MRCFVCDGRMREGKDLSFEAYRSGTVLVASGLKGYVCEGCGEMSYTRESVKKIDAALGKIENVSPGYKRKLSRTKEEITLRLPREIYASMGLKGGEEVGISRLDKNNLLVSIMS